MNVVVVLSDAHYIIKSLWTIESVRKHYQGELVYITIDFHLVPDLIQKHNLTTLFIPGLDVSRLLTHYREHPCVGSDDHRETTKTAQWNKLYLFHPHFRKYSKVLYLDAGMFVSGDVSTFFELDTEGKITALDDAHPEGVKRFGCQLEKGPEKNKLLAVYPGIEDQKYFLNCLFLFDGKIIEEDTLSNLISLMQTYFCFRTNEMGVMNLYFNLIKKIWKPLDIYQFPPKILMDWTNREGPLDKYICVKYPKGP